MTIYEIREAREKLEEKGKELSIKIEEADEVMRLAYKNFCTAEDDTDNFSDEEVEELCNIYEAHCETVDSLEEKMEILTSAIKLFYRMETVANELTLYGIWEG